METTVQEFQDTPREIRNHSGIRWALLLSLLLHAAGIWYFLTESSSSKPDALADAASTPLIARLAPPTPPVIAVPARPAEPAAATAPARPQRVPTPRKPAPARPPAPPSILAVPPVTAPVIVATPEPEPLPAPTPVPPPPVAPPVAAEPVPQRMPPQVTDLSAYIAQQRRAIGDPDLNAGLGSSAREIENQRRNRIVAGNLGGTGYRGAGNETGSGGGIFRIKRIGSDDAEFFFAGFNKDMQRRTPQLIEVRKGENPDIQIAIIRKMIAIIREEVQGDFRWQSQRLGQDIWLSARIADDEALQRTLMREMFPERSAQARP